MQKFNLLLLLSLSFTLQGCAQETTPNAEQQIIEATSAAPEDTRDGAAVYGYTSKGNLTLLREGTNSLICLADDPNREGFQSVCYHQDLEPFMIRGRELRAEGKNNLEIFDTREAEAKAGTLKMPGQPTTMHLLEGKSGQYDPESKSVTGANYRYVVYIPWATAESTGLPIQPVVPGGPWIMDPGTHRAHIMISTPPQQ
ncbi:hypothetical protein [Flavilitoribacter nigricans]|uniref:Lipoprotein n=1 Tax=Flavilitoribacter nigricans (strain ATCC 23147 / DSM 23189 / NBRC 102662 / NCIMB 1420 / SS-2) TaxID=1122177 RepID=A0A2D0MZB9_FLAN2|nr:hypothetical protein [Flavilitoribacter nigricans]PHN01621.1 hypothetical protein CRP01_35975 [Flavilitoribacter nigricans DSM 23189 = NBRC 102662]